MSEDKLHGTRPDAVIVDDLQPTVKPSLLSDEDRKWMEKHIAPEFHQVVERYGRVCYASVMNAGQIGYALGMLVQNTQFFSSEHIRRKQMQAVAVIQNNSTTLVDKVLKDAGITRELFTSCKEDVERIGALAGDKTPGTASKIILPS